MEKISSVKAIVIAVVVAITVILFRHITYLSDLWKMVILVIVIFAESFIIDKLVDKIRS